MRENLLQNSGIFFSDAVTFARFVRIHVCIRSSFLPMSTLFQSRRSQILLFCALFLALIAALSLSVRFFTRSSPGTPETGGREMGVPETSYQATFAGETTCLPHKDTTGPQTMECAFGMKTDDGFFIALDMNVLQTQTVPSLETGKHVTVHGLFTPIEMLSSDHWQIYDVRGILSVTSVQQGDESSS